MPSPETVVRVSIAGHLDIEQGTQKQIDASFARWQKTPRGRRDAETLYGFGRTALVPREFREEAAKMTKEQIGAAKRVRCVVGAKQGLRGLPFFDYHDLIRRCGFSSRASATIRLRRWREQGVIREVGEFVPSRFQFVQ